MPHVTDPYRDRYALRTTGMTGSEIRALFAVAERPEVISLSGGKTCTDVILPRAADLCQAVLARGGHRALQYGVGSGIPELHERLVELMATGGIEADPHHVMITDGAQQALELLATIFVDPGDVILAEGPTYVGALDAFSSLQAQVRSVEMDEDGIVPEALEAALERLAGEGRRAKFLYLVPTFQNPSGVTLTVERRRRVLEICRAAELLIVEDDPYAQLRFEGEDVPPLRALSEDGIIYLGTLSKVFSPGIRIGWALAPEPVRDRLVLAKEAANLCSSPFTQMIAEEYLGSGHVDEDLQLIRKIYRERRDTMLDAAAEHFPPEAHLSVPQGGLFVWATLPAPVDTKAMLARALEAGVAYVPGTAFYPLKRDGRRSMRLNFSFPTPEEIEEGMRRLGTVIADELELARSLDA